MAIATYPDNLYAVKSVQRGYTSSASTITISTVNPSKTFTRSFSDGASGTVAITGTSSGTYSPTTSNIGGTGGTFSSSSLGAWPDYTGSRSFTAGQTSVTSGRYGIYLSSPTQIVADGSCYWEVIEYN